MHELIEALRRDAKAFGPQLATTAYERGLAVTDREGKTRPIPVTATPIIIDSIELRRRAQLSTLLSSAGFKMAKAVLDGPDRQLLAGALSPVERELADKTFRQIERLATTRVDYFVSGSKAWALEINATIPAMQGYSDIAANTFIEVVGKHLGMKNHHIAGLMAKNGSNALALYRALADGYARERKGLPQRIALLCRRNDAQISELRYLAERFTEFGSEAEVVFPDELSGDDEVRARGKTFDMVYRHLFARRLEEIDAPYVRQLFGELPGRRAVLLNPPASQVEVKTTFALLSQALEQKELARQASLTEQELMAIREAVPWTRPFRRGATQDPSGERVDDLVARVASEPARFVLKRAWDYGGKTVFIGASHEHESFAERVKATYGTALSWAELCARAAEDRVGGGYIVQELVATEPEEHLLCSERGLTTESLYVDFSAYGSVGLEKTPQWGGVCRGSISRIVNILAGGGVLPLITSEVAESLKTAFRAR